eukprot:3685248-Prymnesium_polylepis.1
MQVSVSLARRSPSRSMPLSRDSSARVLDDRARARRASTFSTRTSAGGSIGPSFAPSAAAGSTEGARAARNAVPRLCAAAGPLASACVDVLCGSEEG